MSETAMPEKEITVGGAKYRLVEPEKPHIRLEQRIDLRKIAPARWRLVGYVGRAIFFIAESGNEEANFTINNELAQGDLGSWRAVDNRRSLVVGFGGRAVVAPKPDGQPTEVNVTFENTNIAL